MSSTHLSLHYHLVFGTKDCQPLIDGEWRARLHMYLGGLIQKAGGFPEAVGGTSDHVHLLIGLRATHCLAKVLQDLKQTSSEWVHARIGVYKFFWEEGYGAFTVSASGISTVKEFILRQEERHQRRSFQDEYAALLARSGIRI
ncbi:MAG TPA: IS200/IS605 family transposase [Blastocatellia bacterium]|nr:IS200/IS605 family transposase [Blastocatellia bacterium]